jgi:signal transduction histidine kinase
MLLPVPWHREYDEVMAGGQSRPPRQVFGVNRELQGLRKDGSVIPLEVAVSEAIAGKIFTGIIRDTSGRKQLEREITEIAAAEQRRIGQELHDGVSQELTGLTMMATALWERVLKDSPAAEALASRVVDGLAQVHKQVRHVSHGLIPVEVDAEGLRAALEDLSERIRQQAGIVCLFHCPQPVLLKDALTATHLYHIVQEAANNALRHGRPDRIDIHLRARPDALVLTIRDDGVGVRNGSRHRSGVGIRLMRYRAGLIGGVVHIGPGEEKGTLVTCTLPDWHRAGLPLVGHAS